ncbi:heavy-metal-associated domain-containing protein, partial [Bacillus sp. mrc49]|uniref:heavy-metal-associated domain-containing protein n=1 Tax=Bacillus sp. mrc49 TaxID=2054913 RepID=UPI000C277CE6
KERSESCIKKEHGKVENGFLKVEDMRDENDVNKVLHALNEVWGVRDVEVSLANKLVTFSYDEKAA